MNDIKKIMQKISGGQYKYLFLTSSSSLEQDKFLPEIDAFELIKNRKKNRTIISGGLHTQLNSVPSFSSDKSANPPEIDIY